jgi:hypothetical protein
MPQTTISAAVSAKRPGPEQYASDGVTIGAEVTVDVKSSDEFHAAARGLLAELKRELDAELAGRSSPAEAVRIDIWSGSGDDGNGNGQKPTSREDAPTETPPAERSRSHSRSGTTPEPISNKQAKFLWQLARKGGMRTQDEVASWIAEKLGVDRGVYQLTKQEASKAIDILNNGNGGAKR